jgi:hypothetical protein
MLKRKRYRKRYEGSTELMKVTMKEGEGKRMLFNGNNVVMNECYPELVFRSEYVNC